MDAVSVAPRRQPPPLPSLPLQFRQLQRAKRGIFLASPGSRRKSAHPRAHRRNPGSGYGWTNPARGGIWGSDAITGRARGERYGGRDKKWFQVTFRQLAPRPACTVRTWHPELVRREPFAPRRWRSPTADQCAGARLPSIPVEARFSIRPFARQRRGLISRPIPETASTFLAYIFETILRSDPARSAPYSRPRSAFLWLPGARSAYETRCPIRPQDL